MALRPTIVVFSPLPDSWRWYEQDCDPQVRWLFFNETPQSWLEKLIQRPKLARIFGAVRCVQAAIRERADVIVAHSDRNVFWIAIFMQLLKAEMPLIAYSFNMPSMLTGLRYFWMKAVLFRVNRFVVHSELERQSYAAYFDCPIDRFEVVRWGVEPPDIKSDEPPLVSPPYICAIGKDRRDYPTLIQAMAALPHLQLAIVAQPQNIGDLPIPPNVQVFYNLPLEQTLNILVHAQFMALPLEGEAVPCGHITLVWAMFCRKAIVATRSLGIADYFSAEYTAPTVAAGDIAGWIDALEAMALDQPRREACAEAGVRFAHAYCTHTASLRQCLAVFQKDGIQVQPLLPLPQPND